MGVFHNVNETTFILASRPRLFAKSSADAELQIVALLQVLWRFALRLVMIWLSLGGLTASEIAALFEYDPRTVRRWIDRYNHQGGGWAGGPSAFG